jgi:hypothetical protein
MQPLPRPTGRLNSFVFADDSGRIFKLDLGPVDSQTLFISLLLKAVFRDLCRLKVYKVCSK